MAQPISSADSPSNASSLVCTTSSVENLRPGVFAGAVNTDARHSTFIDIGHDYIQNNITNVIRPSDATDLHTKLCPADRTWLFVTRCMGGTRNYVFSEINQWLEDIKAPNILWIKGDPGAGKSAIASSMVHSLTESRRLGSSFFFRRGNATLSDPAALWRTVAYDLAVKDDAFAEVLTAVMKDRGIDPARPDIELHFKYLVEEPLQKTYDLSTSQTTPSIIIVIDALDECDYDLSRAAQRKALLDTLVQWSNLPNTFKLIVTGRDDRIPQSFRVSCRQILLPTGSNVTVKANEDIRHFLEVRFSELPGSLFPEWPGNQILDILTARAAGLFIWADAVMKFLEQDLPTVQLDLILSRDLGEGDNLAVLYKQVLDHAFRGIKDSSRDAFKFVLATLVLAKSPFHCDDLYHFLSDTKQSVNFILSRLSSVISITDNRLQIFHLSFSEYLCDSKRCPAPFLIDRERYNCQIAMACFRHMKEDLKFNICDLETSHLFNKNVVDLPQRIKTNISGSLSYSCRFWADHLRDVPTSSKQSDDILPEIREFLHSRFLFWLEVMSLLHNALVANVALMNTISWIRNSDKELSAFAEDARRFVFNFGIPISASVPHIYLSALLFAPAESLISRWYQPMFPNIRSAVSGRDKYWPAMMNVCHGHTETVQSVAFSPDGKFIVSGSYDKTIRIWDTESCPITILKGHTDHVWSLAFSPDGSHLVSGSRDKTIRVWDMKTGQTTTGPLHGHTDCVASVAFSPDGSRLVSGSWDQTIRIWDAKTGQIVTGPFDGHTGRVKSVAFSPDGHFVVSGSDDMMIRIWDAKTGQTIVGPLDGHVQGVNSVAFSPEGNRVVSGSGDSVIQIWDSRAGQHIIRLLGHSLGVLSVAFLPDGRHVISGALDNTIRIWDTKTGKTTTTFLLDGHSDFLTSIAFSRDGKQIVSGSFDKTIGVWEVLLVNALNALVKESRRERFYPPWSVKTASSLEGHKDIVWSVVFSPDGHRVASGSQDKTIRIWDVQTGQTITGPLNGHTRDVLSLAFSPDSNRVVSGSDDNTILIWDAKSGKATGTLLGHTDSVAVVAFSPDGGRVASGSCDNMVRIWDTEICETTTGPLEGHTDSVWSVAFSQDGNSIVSGSEDKTIRIWDANTGQTIIGPLEGHTECVLSVAFSQDGSRIVSGSEDNTIRIWNAETGRTTSTFEGHTVGVTSAVFSPDGRHVVSGSFDKTIRIWDVESGQAIFGHFRGHTHFVSSVAISSSGTHIATGSWDKTIRIWDAQVLQSSPMNSHVDISKPTEDGYAFHLDNTFYSDGWLHSQGGNDDEKDFLVFWVPPTTRTRLCGTETLHIIGGHTARLNWGLFKHGTSWTQWYSPLDENIQSSSLQSQVVSCSAPGPSHAFHHPIEVLRSLRGIFGRGKE